MRLIAALGLAALSFSPQSGRSLLLNPGAPEFQAHAPAVCHVRLDTSKGVIVIEVTRAWAPLGADRFVSLVRYGYYDDMRFFRVVANSWAQFGINGDPAVAKAWRTKTFPDDPFKISNTKGTIAFAYAVPNGRTTQVFLNLKDNSTTHDVGPNGPFAVFGRVVEGMDVIDALNSDYGDRAVGGIRAGHQDPFFDGGNAYVDREFPKMDRINKATVEGVK